jgi:hypothetical protein
MKILHFITILLITINLYSCSQDRVVETSNASDTTKVSKLQEPVKTPVDTFNTQLSHLLAGKTLPYRIPNITIYGVSNYNSNIRTKWDQLQSKRLDLISSWISSRFNYASSPDTAFVFYPFSGGDFLHVHTLYPDANTYFLVAREDVGIIPNLFLKDSNFVLKYLHDVDYVLRDIYTRSYFITMNMHIDTKQSTFINGMLPVLFWTLGNLDFEILKLNYYKKNASINQLEKIDNLANGIKPTLVELKIRKKGELKNRTLYYYSCDISDNGFLADSLSYNYLLNTVPKGCNAMVKSASYLLHYINFSKIRSLILDRSKILIQDDTGIPFKYFKSDVWSRELYGIYEHPIADFDSSVFQYDLHMAYKDSTMYKGRLNFSMGYHWGSKNQNELIFIKK